MKDTELMGKLGLLSFEEKIYNGSVECKTSNYIKPIFDKLFKNKYFIFEDSLCNINYIKILNFISIVKSDDRYNLLFDCDNIRIDCTLDSINIGNSFSSLVELVLFLNVDELTLEHCVEISEEKYNEVKEETLNYLNKKYRNE